MTAVYSVVEATLLRPLPYPEPERLAHLVLRSEFEGAQGLQQSQDGATWEAFLQAASTVDLAVSSPGLTGVNFSSGAAVGYLRQERVSAGFFRVLGVPPLIGREFTAEEDRPGGPPLVILSHALWQSAFHSDPAVVGKTALIAGETHEITGVAARDFRARENVDMWTPLRPSRSGEGSGINYFILARLRPGVTWSQAESEIESIGQGLLPQTSPQKRAVRRYGLMNLQNSLTEEVRTPLILILCATGIVLLIGCANVAGMLLARGSARSPEFATRIALGASRFQLFRQLIVESALLGVAGGIAGIAAGFLGLEAMKVRFPSGFGLLQEAALNVPVLVSMSFISFTTALLFGIFPGLQAGRADLRQGQIGRGVLGAGRPWLRRTLSTIQIAMAAFLLVGAGLLSRSFGHLWRLEPGFDGTNVITANFSLRDARYQTAEATQRLFDGALTRMSDLPGVESAAVALSLPLERGLNTVFQKPGESADSQVRLTNMAYASPRFFETLRIPVIRGRGLLESDRESSLSVMVVNQAFARFHFQSEDPLGAQLRFGKEIRQIVGVVGDVQQQAGWGSFGPMAPVPAAYIPAAQAQGLLETHVWFSPAWIVRTQHRPRPDIREAIQQIVASVDPLLPISQFRTLEEIKSAAFARQRFLATLLGVAAALALILSTIGIYAMISNSVVERTREFGIRLALGATMAQAIRSGARPGIVCAIFGMTIGLIAAGFGAELLRGLVFGIRPADPLTFLVVGAAVLLVSTAASVAPALRIARLEPATTLRQE